MMWGDLFHLEQQMLIDVHYTFSDIQLLEIYILTFYFLQLFLPKGGEDCCVLCDDSRDLLLLCVNYAKN